MPSPFWRQTGGVWPVGIPTSLTWYDVGAILSVIRMSGIRLVVEIGVEHGGLAALLGAQPGLTYRGIDITLEPLQAEGLAIYERNAFDPATLNEVRGWMDATDGPALLLCDGGDKPRELRMYAALLRPGDVLLGHDYHNEYVDAAIADIPATRIRTDWLDDTLLCMFGWAP